MTWANMVTEARDMLQGWKAKIVAGAVFALGLLQLYDPNAIVAVLPENWQHYAPLAIAAVIYTLEQFIKGRVVDQKG